MREAEIYLLLSFFLTGSLVGILFDTRGILRPRKRASRRNAVSDLLYGLLAVSLIGSAVVLFAGGSLRVFPLLALAFGFWLEKRFFSPAFRPWWRRVALRLADGWRGFGIRRFRRFWGSWSGWRKWLGWPKKKA